MADLVELVPDDCAWWSTVEFDERGICERTVRLTRRHATQIATLAGESLTLQEAIRMLLAQGIWSLAGSDYNAESIEMGSDWDVEQKPNAVWFEDINWEDRDAISRKAEFTEGQLADLASVAPNARSLQEAIRLVVNHALSERAGG